jgi:hypothetical protein
VLTTWRPWLPGYVRACPPTRDGSAELAAILYLAGHAFAPLLTDTSLADAVGRAETALGIEFALWRRL